MLRLDYRYEKGTIDADNICNDFGVTKGFPMLNKNLPTALQNALEMSRLLTATDFKKLVFKRFDGGHHNDIYRVRTDKKDYAVRLSKKPKKRLGYFSEEFHNQKIAAEAKIAPQILYADENTGTLIYPYIVGAPVTREHLLNPTFCGTVTRAIKTIHSLKKPFLYHHNFLRSIEKRQDRTFGKNLENCPQEAKKLAIYATRAMELVRGNPVAYTPCHADLILDNILKVNNHVTLIDWELSGMSDPHEDLANFICFGNLTPKSIDMVLSHYFNTPDPIGRARTYLFIVIILYYWILRHAEDLIKFPDSERLLLKQQRRLNEANDVIVSQDYKKSVIILKKNVTITPKIKSAEAQNNTPQSATQKPMDKEYK